MICFVRHDIHDSLNENTIYSNMIYDSMIVYENMIYMIM